ncbi:MAG: ArsR family transcriptional regulator [Gammaproteobacteria bacterium]|jgi:ArsR family transcriptional regulator|nr:ArsR family transcriptional regulator [Gammaproteobacteria bacterium]
MHLQPENLTRAMADSTRLRILMLLPLGEERCVCELTQALGLPQPKISRHLAVLRETGILIDRRAGLWIHYRLHPELPDWAREVLAALAQGCTGQEPFASDRGRLTPVVAAGKASTPCS